MNESRPRLVERMLARLDRVRGLGGGRTHAAFLGLFFAASLGLYLLVLKVRGPAGERLKTRTAWDDWFPFAPWWMWVYLLPYAIGPVLAAVMRRPAFAWYIRRASVVVGVSLAVFVVVPTQTVRPLRSPDAVELGDDLTARLYRHIDTVDDPPANAAPSLHVSLSCLLAWGLSYDRPRWWWATLAGAAIVWLSTLYTAQHHLIDVISGVALASLAAIGRPDKPLAASSEAASGG